MRPFIENIFGPSRHPQAAVPITPTPRMPVAAPGQPTAVRQVYHLQELQDIIKTNKCVMIDFTSVNCPPCRVISPEFETLVSDLNSNSISILTGIGFWSGCEPEVKVVGVKVELSSAFEIGQAFGISATPTFMFYLNGEKLHDFRGANVQELKNSANFLVAQGYPGSFLLHSVGSLIPLAHSHTTVKLPTILSKTEYILFKASSNPEQIISKLSSFLESKSLNVSLTDAFKETLVDGKYSDKWLDATGT